MSRRSARNRRRGTALAVKARRPPANPGGVTLSGDQLTAIMSATQRAGQLANPLPRPASWSADAFPPGQPLRPAFINRPRTDTGRAEPRLFELPISSNINVNTAPYVPWRVLNEAADMPLFRKCIERRKGICDLDFVITVDPKAVAREAAAAGQHEKDVESAMRDKYAADIVRVSDWLQNPDAQNDQDWTAWTKALMENRLVYDATVVYPQVSYGGDLLALRVLDGSTIKPLLDEYGARPAPPFPFAQQILYGFPRGEFTATVVPGPDGKPTVPGWPSDELMYERTIYRPKTPYGMSATEIALLDGIVWMRRMGWMVAEYTEGVMPAAHVEVDGATDWTVEQWESWQAALNDHLGGNTAQRLKFPLFPPGTKPVQSATIPEQYKPDYDMFLVKLIAGDFGMTATELGFPEVGSLGASFHEGEEDVLNRVTRIPDAQWLARIATKLARRHLAMPNVLMVKILGLESEDEAAADTVAAAQVASGRMTMNEDRARRGEPAYDFPEADMPMLTGQRGLVFIEGASELAPPGTLIQPAAVKPGDPGDSATQNGEPGDAGKPAPAGGKTAKAIAQGKADQVYAQLTEDYPKAALGWVHHAAWDGPQVVPFTSLDMTGRKKWRASHEPDRVADFAGRIRKRLAGGKTQLKKPAVVVFEPGKKQAGLIVDGHHRTLGAEQAGQSGVLAWVGHVHENAGPWMELHDLQFTRDSGSGPDAGDDVAADQVGSAKSLGWQAYKAGALARDMTRTAEDLAATEVAAYRRWARKGGPRGVFTCNVVTKASAGGLAPEMAADGRVVFKDGDDPKAHARRGLAGAGISSS